MDGGGRSQPVTADQSDVRPTQGLPRDGKVGPKASAATRHEAPARSTNRYPPLPSQKLPAGMVARSIAFDSAATVTMKGDAADVHGLRSTSVTVNMANNSRAIVKLEGTASFVVLTDTGQVRRLGTGRTLIGPDMHNLLSPSAMFKDSDSGLRYVHLEPDNSALVLHDGARVPLRWDGRLFHLDYWSTTANAVVDAPQLCAQVLAEADYRHADAALCRHFEIAETDVALPESAFGGKDERGRDITTSMLMPHRVIEPHGLSHSGLEHRRHGHTNTAEINIDRARRGLPPIRLPPPGHRCAICEIANARRQTIPQVAAEQPAVPQLAAEQPLLPNGECACGVCINNRQRARDQLVGGRAGDDVSADLCGPFTVPALDGSVYAIVYYSRTTGHIYVEGLRSKAAALVAASLERYEQLCGPAARLHHDGGTEFLGATSAYCRKQGIRQTFTCPYSSFQNSNAESTVGYVKRAGRRILLESGLPDPFWLRCMHTACVIKNQMSSSRDPSASPLQLKFGGGRQPHELVVLGSVAYTLVVPKSARKDNLKCPAFAGIFVGYSDTCTGYLIYSPGTGKIMPRRDVVFDEHWRWRSAEPTADELLVPTTRDGSSPVPAEWRHPVQERQTKEAERSAAPAQIEPAAADQGGPPGAETRAEAEPQHHDDMPALVDSSDDEDSDDDEVSDQGGPVPIGRKPLERAPWRTPLAATQAAARPGPGPTPAPAMDVSAPCGASDQGGPLRRSSRLQSSHGSVAPAQASEQPTPAAPSDMPKSSPASVAPPKRATRRSPVDDGSMPVPKVSTVMPLRTCVHGLSQKCVHGCHDDGGTDWCVHLQPAAACEHCRPCHHGPLRMDCKKCSPPDIFEHARPTHVRWPTTKQPNSGRGKRLAKAARARLPVDVWMDQPLYDTGKAASALTPNKAIIDRCAAISGRSFVELVTDQYKYWSNHGMHIRYGKSDLRYDVENGYLEYRPGEPTPELARLVEYAMAMSPTLDEYVFSCLARDKHDDDLSDAETVAQPDATAPDPGRKVGRAHVTLCCGTMSHVHSALSKDKDGVGLVFDKLTPDEFQPMLDDLPPDVAARVIYVQEDISKWSYNTFKNLVRKHLDLSVNQLASVHGSPPCTTWSRAHHGKNPHRQRGKGRNLLPRTALARHHDKILEAVCDVMRNVSNQSFHTVLSVENPLSNFKHMPAVRCLLSSPGWMERTADHCMLRRDGERLFPRKRSTWLLYNVRADIKLQRCDGSCGCTVRGMYDRHRLLVCNRDTMVEGQEVLKDPKDQGRIPLGAWDVIHGAKCRSVDARTNPNRDRPQPLEPLNEPLFDTGKARDADVRARCQMVHGRTFAECQDQPYYIGKFGETRKYTAAELLSDIKHGYVMLQAEVLYSACHVSTADKCARRRADGNMSCLFETAVLQQSRSLFEEVYQIFSGDDPINEKDADSRPDCEEWKLAKWAELDALIGMGCWRYRPKSDKHKDPVENKKKLYRGKFVFKQKPSANGMPPRKKARYVISDPKFLQKLTDVDCFSPMCRFETVRWLLSVMVERDWECCHSDVKNAFPNAELPEEVWMEVPKAVLAENPELADSYAYVSRALYGLGHAPRAWSQHLDKWFRSKGYVSLDADSCLYVLYDSTGHVQAAAATFVDDCVHVGTQASCAAYRAMLQADFETSGQDEVPTDFLGMQITRDRKAGTLKIFQEKYIEKMAERYQVGLPTGSRAPTPLPHTAKLDPAADDEERCDPSLFRSICGALQFASHCCRPDVSQSIKELCKHLIDPALRHYKAAQQCLSYLLATKDYGLTYTKHAIRGIHGRIVAAGVLEVFSDASFAECMLTRRSTSGYVAMRCGAAVSWGARSQGKVAHSSSDSELRALAEAAREALWLRKLEYAFSDPTERLSDHADGSARWQRTTQPATKTWEDNRCTIKWVLNPCAHSKVKHIDVPLKALREDVTEFGNLDIEYIDTTRQMADVMTKNLSPKVHWRLVAPMLNVQIPGGAESEGE